VWKFKVIYIIYAVMYVMSPAQESCVLSGVKWLLYVHCFWMSYPRLRFVGKAHYRGQYCVIVDLHSFSVTCVSVDLLLMFLPQLQHWSYPEAWLPQLVFGQLVYQGGFLS
jgi:hypothetical protein